MKQLSKLYHDNLIICALFLCTLQYSCKTVGKEESQSFQNSYYTVKKVKKLKDDVFVIYANRNDSVFKIVSYYDGNKAGKKQKLVKGKHFQLSIESVFGDFERKHNLMPKSNAYMEFRGVAVGKEPEHNIDDVWFCKELNGPYLIK